MGCGGAVVREGRQGNTRCAAVGSSSCPLSGVRRRGGAARVRLPPTPRMTLLAARCEGGGREPPVLPVQVFSNFFVYLRPAFLQLHP